MLRLMEGWMNRWIDEKGRPMERLQTDRQTEKWRDELEK